MFRKNLELPACRDRASSPPRQGIQLAPIRTAVRTGDTPAWERQQMGKQPPHILVTTPESLFILLTAERSRAMLRTTRTVIVDEIHAMADDKRGSHLALTLARLDALVSIGRKPQRIGLSATVKPIEEVAALLGPSDPRDRRHVGTGARWIWRWKFRRMNWERSRPTRCGREIYDRLAELILAHRTTLVFVNTRRLSERVAHHLAERLGENGAVLPHHGSLSRSTAARSGRHG